MFVGLLVALLWGWGWAGIRDLALHPPLGPYQPRWWWQEGLLRLTKTSWKALLVIQTLFLSALIAADLGEVKGRAVTQRWFGGMRLSLGVVALFVVLGLVAGAALQIWRISNREDWLHGSRSVVQCFAPVVPLGLLLVSLWAALLT
jgi:hypothetical protein